MLDLVRVLLSVRIDALHASTFGCTGGTRLSSVDVVVETVEGAADNVGRDALGDDLHVVELVDLSGTKRVVAKGAQSPCKRSLALHKLLVKSLLGELVQFLVGKLLATDLSGDLLEGLLVLNNLLANRRVGLGRRGVGDVLVLVVLNDCIVGDNRALVVLRVWAAEQKRTLNEHVPLNASVPLDDPGVHKWNEEERGQEGDT